MKIAVSILLTYLIHVSVVAQRSAQEDLTPFGGITAAYSVSGNSLPKGQREYTLQPSVNGILGVMQADFGFRYQSHGFTATLVGQQGWFAEANYTGDDYAYRYLQQAWAEIGVVEDVSIRAGVMPSHIGYESINERENLVVSRLFCSDATPYYETGVAVQWRPSQKLSLEGLLLNGWQRIVAVDDDVAWGSRVVWRPDSTLTLNWSTFYGNMLDRRSHMQPSAARRGGWRFYSNVWAEWKASANLTVAAIADNGHQTFTADSSVSTWTVAAIAGYRLGTHWRIAVRAEHFSDPASVLVQSIPGTGFVASSISTNIDWSISPKTTIRAELRRMSSSAGLFPTSSGFAPNETYGTVAVDYRL